MAREDAVKVAQRMLRAEFPSLVIDGKWGQATQRAFDLASAPLHREVIIAVTNAGESLNDIQDASKTTKVSRKPPVRAAGVAKKVAAPPSDRWISEADVMQIIATQSSMTGVSASLMKRFLDLEARKQSVNGVTAYDVKSVSPNGMYRGLFQMGSAAWSDARASDSGVSSYGDVFDAKANTRAAMAYVKVNMRYAKAKGYTGEFTPEVLYAMHNQGAGGFMKLLRDKVAGRNVQNQSASAQALIRAAANQNGVRLA
jgi:hypothetical protein